MIWLSARLSEKSTYTGLFTLLSLVGHLSISGNLADALTTAGMAIGGVLTTIIAEKSNA